MFRANLRTPNLSKPLLCFCFGQHLGCASKKTTEEKSARGSVKLKIEAMTTVLDSPSVLQLRRHYVSLKRITVTTMFSGSEIFFFVLGMVLNHLGGLFGSHCSPELVHCFEKDAWKRDFVMRRFKPMHMGGDVLPIPSSNFECHDYVTDSTVTINATDMLVAGFECDTVCKLQNLRGDKDKGATCMEDGTGKTGTTGRATLAFIKKFRYRCTLLENSKVLGAQNLQFITDYLNVFGFFVHCFQAKAEIYGSATKRERQYLLITPVSDTEIDQTVEGFVKPLWVAPFSALMDTLEIGCGDPYDLLLTSDSLIYQESAITIDHNLNNQ